MSEPTREPLCVHCGRDEDHHCENKACWIKVPHTHDVHVPSLTQFFAPPPEPQQPATAAGQCAECGGYPTVICVSSAQPVRVPLGTDDAEWESAFASTEFAQIVTRARAQIANGQTKPMRLEDL